MTCFPVKKKDERRMIYGRSFLINNHPALVYLHNQLSGVRLYDFSSNLHFPFGEFFSVWLFSLMWCPANYLSMQNLQKM